VAVYGRKCAIGLFDVIAYTCYGCVVGMELYGGSYLRMAGGYVPPQTTGSGVKEAMEELGQVDVFSGDFNTRHPRWSNGLDSRVYPSGVALLEMVDIRGFEICAADDFTYRDVYVLDITLHKVAGCFTHRYVDIAGLDHMAQLLLMNVVEPDGVIRCGIPGRRVHWDILEGKVEEGMKVSGKMVWDDVVDIVLGIPRAPKRKKMPAWWTGELATMRAEV